MIVLIALIVSFGCATSKKATSTNTAVAEPAAMEKTAAEKESDMAKSQASLGEWEYVIKDLPDGDTKGILHIQQEGGKYVGTIQSDMGSIPLKDLVIENEKLKSASFQAQGYNVGLSGTFSGDAFTGKISAAGYDFPVTAVRKK
jgi:hypothetical protein